MRLEERRIDVRHLQPGMYVCRLDREWVDTPFPLQGLMIHGRDDIDALAEYCNHVYVDIALGIAPDERLATLRARRSYTPIEVAKQVGRCTWHDTASFDDELPRAREAQQLASTYVTRVLNDVREGRAISADDVRRAVEPMVGSMLRNMDAFLWIESLRKRDAYDYSHALNCSALAAAFGRHIGFPEDILTDLASGGLLLDVGKLRVDEKLFARRGPLDRAETAQVRRHVEHGLAIIDEGEQLPAHVQDMIRTHHERENGSGYPAGLSGAQIPLMGRIAAIIDSYDAMTSDRSHRRAMSRHAALQELYRARGTLYAAETIEQFMQCLNVFPVGSLVELSDGRVAVVMAQNAARRLLPRVMVLTTPDKRLAEHFVSVDLMQQAAVVTPTGRPAAVLKIASILEPGSHGLDPAELFL